MKADTYLSNIAFKYISGDWKSGLAFPDSTSATHTRSLLLLSSYLKIYSVRRRVKCRKLST